MSTLALVLLLALARSAEDIPEPPRLQKLARVLELEDSRSIGVGEMDRLLADSDRGVRRRACLAAGRIGDPLLVPSLVGRLSDVEPEIRQMAAFALGLIGDKSAAPPLLKALDDPEMVVRLRAAEALGRVGDAAVAARLAQKVVAMAPQGVPNVAVRGDDPGGATDAWAELRFTLVALARLKDETAATSALLYSGQSRFDWWAATWVAMRLEKPSLRPVLETGAASADGLSRAYAARGLAALKDPSVFDLLLKLTRDRESRVVVAALRALGTLGDARAVAVLVPFLSGNDTLHAWEALRALAALPADPAVKGRVVPLLVHEEPWIRAAALRVLARLDREELAFVLSGQDPEPSPLVRASLAEGLGEAGDEPAQRMLFAMLNDPAPGVRSAVLAALGRARGKDAADTLRKALTDPDDGIRSTAIDSLSELKLASVEDAAQVYRSSLPAQGGTDDHLDSRRSAIGAAAVLAGEDAARKLLRDAATGDPSRIVRVAAAKALSAQKVDAPNPGPEPAVRPFADYAEFMVPYDPRPGVTVYGPRVVIHTVRGVIEMQLDIVDAPLATDSFVNLARRGYFDGLTFHRVVPGFVAQGGDPRGDGTGGPGYTLRCEYGEKAYGRGVVGMALSGKDTGGSQFFITLDPAPHLDGNYAVLGWVTSGMEIADALRPGDVMERVEVYTGR